MALNNENESLSLGYFIIRRPREWDLEHVELEIHEYDYTSTKISIDELRILHNYIGDIITKSSDTNNLTK